MLDHKNRIIDKVVTDMYPFSISNTYYNAKDSITKYHLEYTQVIDIEDASNMPRRIIEIMIQEGLIMLGSPENLESGKSMLTPKGKTIFENGGYLQHLKTLSWNSKIEWTKNWMPIIITAIALIASVSIPLIDTRNIREVQKQVDNLERITEKQRNILDSLVRSKYDSLPH